LHVLSNYFNLITAEDLAITEIQECWWP